MAPIHCANFCWTKYSASGLCIPRLKVDYEIVLLNLMTILLSMSENFLSMKQVTQVFLFSWPVTDASHFIKLLAKNEIVLIASQNEDKKYLFNHITPKHLLLTNQGLPPDWEFLKSWHPRQTIQHILPKSWCRRWKSVEAIFEKNQQNLNDLKISMNRAK